MDERPKYLLLSEVVRNYLIGIGALIGGLSGALALILWQGPLFDAQASVANFDSQIKKEMLPFQSQLNAFEVELNQHRAEREKAESELATVKFRQSRTPILQVVPEIRELRTIQDVREIRLEAHFTNAGTADVILKQLELNVYRGIPNKEMAEIVGRTKEISVCLATMQRFNNAYNPPTSDIDRTLLLDAEKRFEELRMNCPHGNAYLVGVNSKHVNWQLATSEKRNTEITLRESESAFEPFDLVLT